MAVFNKDKTKSNKGRTTYDLSILTDIATVAVSEVEGVAPNIAGDDGSKETFLQKIKIDFDGDKVYCDLSIYVHDYVVVPEVAFKVQEAVKTAIETMTKFKITAVDVRILGVIFKAEEVFELDFEKKINGEDNNA
ncbi:MAG: Asp23/Gls24 family envelope stress response protein [Bacillota bacterium]